MSHGAGKGGRKRGGHEEEHENHERWAVSYADMMTVLMALFLVLFAMSSIDVKKFEALRTSLAKGFGNEALPSDGGSGLQDGSTDSAVSIDSDVSPVVLGQSASGSSASGGSASAAGPAAGTGAGDELAARAEAAHLQQIQDQVNAALAAKGLTGTVNTSIDSRGLEINVVANDIFFKSASAAIQPRGYQVLDALGPVLAKQTEAVSIEGHTNSLAISSAEYPTNWELSTARAVAVLRHLSEGDGVAAARLQAVGYGDAHPLYSDDDPRSVESNRRVDIVVESSASAEVRALLPGYVGSSQGSSTPSTSTEGTPG